MSNRTIEKASMNEDRGGVTVPTRNELAAAARAGIRLSSRSIRTSRAKAKQEAARKQPQPQPKAAAKVAAVDAETLALRARLKRLEAKIAATK
jgi:hypothetical protein